MVVAWGSASWFRASVGSDCPCGGAISCGPQNIWTHGFPEQIPPASSSQVASGASRARLIPVKRPVLSISYTVTNGSSARLIVFLDKAATLVALQHHCWRSASRGVACLAMCGIHVVVSRDGFQSLPTDTRTCLCNRGPDHLGEVQRQVDLNPSDAEPVVLSFTSTVLALRGDHVTQQPFNDASSGSVLCWNGEAWKIAGAPVQGNDGEAIFALLLAASGCNTDGEAVLDVLRSIVGPFAFVYFDAASSRLYYGRDRLGRRSLLLNQEEGLRLSSIAERTSPAWAEVGADGIYVLDLPAWSNDQSLSPALQPWKKDEEETVSKVFPSRSLAFVLLTAIGSQYCCLQHGAATPASFTAVSNVAVGAGHSAAVDGIAQVACLGRSCTAGARFNQ